MTIPNVSVTIDPNNPDVVTIDASGLTTTQRDILARLIGWDSSSPIPLVPAILHDSMVKRSFEMDRLIDQDAIASTAAMKSATTGN